MSASHHAPEGSQTVMTDNSTKVQDAANGTAKDKPVPAQRSHGIKRLREEECYQATSLIETCLQEAEHLVRKVHNKAYNRVVDHDGSKGTQPIDPDEVMPILDEAYECTSLALTYLFNVSTHLRDETQPPF
jgi:hypothetical protein